MALNGRKIFAVYDLIDMRHQFRYVRSRNLLNRTIESKRGRAKKNIHIQPKLSRNITHINIITLSKFLLFIPIDGAMQM